jgi:predicted TIM-barrel fold metal-dependent hydrolase
VIVDCHVHIFEKGRGGPFDLPASAEDVIREMDAANVDVSVVLPLPGVATNEFVHHQARLHPDRLCALYTPEFDKPAETLRLMAEFFSEFTPAGIKIHPRLQGVTVADTIVREVLAWASEQGHTVLFDVFPYGPHLNNPAIHPLAYGAIAEALPDLKIVLAHSGGYKVQEAFLVAKSFPNIFLDISFTPVYFKGSSVAADLAFVCRRLPSGRMLYGSDFPYVPFAEHLETARELTLGLTEPSKAMLFGEAARSLFRIRG